MVALPSDITKFTRDGVVLSSNKAAGDAVLAAHPNARSTDEGREVEMFFANPSHAQLVLNQRFALLSNGAPLHDGVELEVPTEGLAIPVAPTVPCWEVRDTDGRLVQVRTRSLVRSFDADRIAVEVLE